jgi:hypothetical protein
MVTREGFEALTLRTAQEQINREWPGRDAPGPAWRRYYERAVSLFERVAEVDADHHFEALYWAGQARESLRLLNGGRPEVNHGTR